VLADDANVKAPARKAVARRLVARRSQVRLSRMSFVLAAYPDVVCLADRDDIRRPCLASLAAHDSRSMRSGLLAMNEDMYSSPVHAAAEALIVDQRMSFGDPLARINS